ncbi:MAG: chorismate mutase [Clostridiales Family XIII bacterium]|jgi:chorismate mutase/prephenate dehydratase|nr:chorismate mutase [Clostridiales Family XIII bacterium]
MMDTELKQFRDKIDLVDEELVELFERRMQLAREVGDLKRENNLSIYDGSREQEVTERAAALVLDDLKGEVSLFVRSLMALAREYQRRLQFAGDEPFLPPPRAPKTDDVRCVHQGAPGAWSEQAARKLFPDAALSAVPFFEDVFDAVKTRDADYGVVAIENSQSGAIGETYDLLRTYGCYVVGRTWIDINHCLIAREGTTLDAVREVYSHPEGFKQCHRFLQGKAWDLIACSNTAVAAGKVREADSDRVAAIGSRFAAEINGLEILAPDVMDAADNRTSFVVIGREPEYDERSDLISVTFSLAHRAGSLCEALLPFMAAGVDLTRIESRPASAGSYRFFAELAGNILDPMICDTLRHAAGVTEYLEVLGCYRTI